MLIVMITIKSVRGKWLPAAASVNSVGLCVTHDFAFDNFLNQFFNYSFGWLMWT